VVSNWTIWKLGTLTRINTFFIATSKSACTVGITQTFILLATNVRIWIWFEVRETGANSSVISGWTLSIDATFFKKTRVNTVPIDACLCQWTFWVTFAASCEIKCSLIQLSHAK
jgi:hypothetical protein